MIGALHYWNRKNIKTVTTNVINYSCSLLVIKLNRFALAILINIYNNYIGINNVYYKTYLIKIIKIIIKDIIFGLHIKNQLKLHIDYIGIFLEGLLEIIDIRKVYFKLFSPLDKAVHL